MSGNAALHARANLPQERSNRVVIVVGVGGRKAHADIAVRRALDQARGDRLLAEPVLRITLASNRQLGLERVLDAGATSAEWA